VSSGLAIVLAMFLAAPVEARPPVPVIFLHGFNSNFATWAQFANVLGQNGWTFGGCPLFDPVVQIVTNLCAPSSGLSAGDIYLMQFSSNQNLTIVEQAAELQVVIGAVLAQNPGQSAVILVGHSMGGLAARGYLEFNFSSPTSIPNVIKVITVGTPNMGSELAVLCQLAGPLCVAFGLNPSSVAVAELTPTSPALGTLNDLADHPLPPSVVYVSVTGTGTPVIVPSGADGDGIVTTQSQNLDSVLASLEPAVRAGIKHTAVAVRIQDRASCDEGFTPDPLTGRDINPLPNETHTCETTDAGVWTTLLGELQFTPSPRTLAAVLPSSRSVQVGSTATAFATLVNLGPGAATGCSIAPLSPVPATFTYQTTDPSTNQTTGSANTPVDVPEGGGQSFVMAFTPTAAFPPTDVSLAFGCTNSDPAPIVPGLDTLLVSASSTAVPDVVALAVTSTGDGIVNISGPTGTGAFAVATVNLGNSGSITVSAETAATLSVDLAVCETDPATGACLATPSPTVTLTINGGATSTFGVFATATGTVPFDPGTNRIFVRFRDGATVIRGATSVAVRTQ
jgi:PGAP1-like protein